ncbi:MAG: molecular chaperone TorD family protein, partial [Dehalococcoidia bacterium]|nr:molecular chaperone TorD family protein [Dehalococcoidia bacterium]
IVGGAWPEELARLLPSGVAVPPIPGDATLRTLGMQYMGTFEIPAGSACPLYTGVYARQRREAMEELLRFYRHFGLTLSEDPRDLPDSVPTVLEFLQFLAWREARAEDGDDGMALRKARRDIVQRHLGPWAKGTSERLADRQELFYPRTVMLLRDLCETGFA